MATRIKIRRDSAANWASVNPILASGEQGYVVNTRQIKVGDGSTRWNDLPYAVTGDLSMAGTTVSSKTQINFQVADAVHYTFAGTFDAAPNADDETVETEEENQENLIINSVAYDNNNNILVSGFYEAGGFFAAKLSPDGQTVLWNKKITSTELYGTSMCTDGNGDVIVMITGPSGSQTVMHVAKLLNSNGSITWQKTLYDINFQEIDQPVAMDYDNANNIVITGYYVAASGAQLMVLKLLGSTGDLIWSRVFSHRDGIQLVGNGLSTDYNNNIYLSVNHVAMGVICSFVIKLNLQGQIVWQTEIDKPWWGPDYPNPPASESGLMTDCAADRLGNLYVGYTWIIVSGPGGYESACGVIKMNGADGTVDWCRTFHSIDLNGIANGVAVDADNNVYYYGTQLIHKQQEFGNQDFNIGSLYDKWALCVAKMDSTGKVLWQRDVWRDQYYLAGSYEVEYSLLSQNIDVNQDTIVLAGYGYQTHGYEADNSNWYTQGYVVQFSNKGELLDRNGWHIETNTMATQFIVLVHKAADLKVESVSFSVDNASLTIPDNTTDAYYVTGISKADVGSMTYDVNGLSLANGGNLDLSRANNGYITSIGVFYGNEGINFDVDYFADGVDTDSAGNSYLACNSHGNEGFMAKVNYMGQMEWHVGNFLFNESVGVAVDPVSQDPWMISLDGNEGFFLTRHDQTGGDIKEMTWVNRYQAQDIYDCSLQALQMTVDNTGKPIVVGLAYDQYHNTTDWLDVTNKGAGLPGSGPGKLVINRAQFEPGPYPAGDGSWYMTGHLGSNLETVTYNVTASNDNTAFVFNGNGFVNTNNPDLHLYNGVEYIFELNVKGETFKIYDNYAVLQQYDDSGVIYDDTEGVGQVRFKPLNPTNLPYAYLSNTHTSMTGNIFVAGRETTDHDLYQVNYFANCATTTNSTTSDQAAVLDVQYSADDTGLDYANAQVYVTSAGNNYSVGDHVVVSGALLGGTTPVNDLLCVVTGTTNGIDPGGLVAANLTPNGTAQSSTIWIDMDDSSLDFSQIGLIKISHDSGSDGFIFTKNASYSLGSLTQSSDDDNFDEIWSVTTDSNNDIIVGGYSESKDFGNANNESRAQTGFVAKIHNEQLAWATCIDGQEGMQTVFGVATDSVNNVYALADGGDYASYATHPTMTKLDGNTGDILWQVVPDWEYVYFGIAMDAENNVIMAGYDNNDGKNMIICKLDPSGNLLFTRQLGGLYNSFNAYNDAYSHNLAVSGDYMYVSFYSYALGDGQSDAVVAKLPLDGSGTGTYANYYYRAVETVRLWKYSRQQFPDDISYGNNLRLRKRGIRSQLIGKGNWEYDYVTTMAADSRTIDIPSEQGGSITGVSRIVWADGTEQTCNTQNIPQVNQNKSEQINYELALDDRGKHIKRWNSGTIYVPNNEKTNFPIGSVITIITEGNTVYLTARSGVYIRAVNAGSDHGSYLLAAYSMVTLLKVDENWWYMSGSSWTVS
jgi:Major tropism determinant N-terminal domain